MLTVVVVVVVGLVVVQGMMYMYATTLVLYLPSDTEMVIS